MNQHDPFADDLPAEDLTWRERDVLHLLAERLTNREIADRLHLAESTVKDYVGRILGKLYVKNRRQAVERARALGLLDRDGKTVARPLTNLPAETTPFVGRQNELADIRRRLVETRLVTLTGPGGIGKTRLALKAAGEMAGDYRDGCHLVSLAPIRSAKHIIQTIAEALRYPIVTREDPQHQLLRYLRNRQLLLVLDNYEHLLESAGIVSEILHAAPDVRILATSRERLNLQSETVFGVGGMTFPDRADSEDALSFDAVTLFSQSARKVRPGFHPSRDELGQIINICQAVQGMPLAIELAAAWLHILNVDEVANELARGLDILSTQVRDAPKRHRSIRTVFDHSWSLLDPTEQEIFRQLSVFRGGFTRDAAQRVTGASLQQLAGLVNKSFLNHDPSSGRLEVHELLRQYAQEQLAKARESIYAQEAHAAYFSELMEQWWTKLKGKDQLQALAEIEADIENVRTSWQYCVDQGNSSRMWMFIYGLWLVYWIRGWHHAGMELFAGAAWALRGKQDAESVALRALATAFQSHFMSWLGLADQGYELAQESVKTLQQLDFPQALALARISVGVNAYIIHRYAELFRSSNEMLRITHETNDKWLVAFALFETGMSALIAENYAEARRLAKSSLQLTEEIGDEIGSALPLLILGNAAWASGRLGEAREFHLRCLRVSEKTGFYFGIQTSSKYLGKVALSMGRIQEAEHYLRQSLEITKEVGFVRDIVNLLCEFARLQMVQNNPELAAELLAFVLQHPASHQTRMVEGRIRDSAEDLLAKVHDELSKDVLAAALERGQKLELDEILDDLSGTGGRERIR